MTKSANRSSAVDPLRMVLAISVVGLHTGFPEAAGETLRQILINGLYRIAVPVFTVISGYFFLNSIQSGRAIPYIRRILTLYAIWMLVYLPIWGPELTSVRHAVVTVIFGYYHLWFLPGIAVGAAIILALTRLQVPPKGLAALALVCAAMGITLQYLVIVGRIAIPLDYYRNGLFVIFPYFAIGYLMAATGFKPHARHAMLVAAIAIAAVLMESLIWFRIADGGFGIDTMVSLYVAAPAIFLAALGSRWRGRGKDMASMAAFVYFAHVMVMIALSWLGLTGDLRAIATVVVSVLLARQLSRVAGGRILQRLT